MVQRHRPALYLLVLQMGLDSLCVHSEGVLSCERHLFLGFLCYLLLPQLSTMEQPTGITLQAEWARMTLG